MRLDAIRNGDIVEVDRLGRRFHALVSGTDGEGLEILPLDRRVTYRSCRAHQVIAHWSKRGRRRDGPGDRLGGNVRGASQLELDPVAPDRR